MDHQSASRHCSACSFSAAFSAFVLLGLWCWLATFEISNQVPLMPLNWNFKFIPNSFFFYEAHSSSAFFFYHSSLLNWSALLPWMVAFCASGAHPPMYIPK